jgi:hypothetical protein
MDPIEMASKHKTPIEEDLKKEGENEWYLTHAYYLMR